MSNYVPVPRRSNIVVQEFENEVLVYDLLKQKAFCLNETASRVWQVCNGKRNVNDIALLLSQESGLIYTEDFVLLALEQLRRDRLLEIIEDVAVDFPDINRRQLIRKIGMASLVTLPFITSIVAPTAAQSGSCLVMAPGSGCSANGTFCAVLTNMCCSCNCAVQPTGPRRCV